MESTQGSAPGARPGSGSGSVAGAGDSGVAGGSVPTDPGAVPSCWARAGRIKARTQALTLTWRSVLSRSRPSPSSASSRTRRIFILRGYHEFHL